MTNTLDNMDARHGNTETKILRGQKAILNQLLFPLTGNI